MQNKNYFESKNLILLPKIDEYTIAIIFTSIFDVNYLLIYYINSYIQKFIALNS